MDRSVFLREKYAMQMLDGEGTFYAERERSARRDNTGRPLFSTMIGLYSQNPLSLSKFHVLKNEEIWLFYEGHPFNLHLLYEDGRYEKVTLGSDSRAGQLRQFVVPANVKQAACLLESSDYALYGCIVVPAFSLEDFSLCVREDLLKQYPLASDIIMKLT